MPYSSGGQSAPLRTARSRVRVLVGQLGRTADGCEGDGNPFPSGGKETAFDSRAPDDNPAFIAQRKRQRAQNAFSPGSNPGEGTTPVVQRTRRRRPKPEKR